MLQVNHDDIPSCCETVLFYHKDCFSQGFSGTGGRNPLHAWATVVNCRIIEQRRLPA